MPPPKKKERPEPHQLESAIAALSQELSTADLAREAHEGRARLRRLNRAEFENSLTYDADDSASFSCTQFPPTGSNFNFYCNPDLDKLFAKEESTADPTGRQQIFNQIHQIYLTEFPFITLYAPTDIAMNKITTHNYVPGPEGASETVGVWNWWCTNGQC